MTMVLQHYKQCAFKRTYHGSVDALNCRVCAQLLTIVAFHAENDCKMPPNQIGCPVLMCDTFRSARFTNKIKTLNFECENYV